MPIEVLATPRAQQQISGLTRKQAKIFDNFLNELSANGCRALAYRLSGHTPLDHICVKHLAGTLRVVMAFETPQRAWILLVGPHDDQDPALNVYAELYRLLGVEPPPDARRDKPPCCDEIEDLPPVLGESLDEILDRVAKLRRTRRLSASQAAEFLGVSRPTLVRLLGSGEIPFDEPGRHRWVRLADLVTYQERSRRRRAAVLDQMVADSDAAGLYDLADDTPFERLSADNGDRGKR
jgi:excisionase family DNA binding protein